MTSATPCARCATPACSSRRAPGTLEAMAKKATRDKTLCEGKHIRLVQRGTYEFASRRKASGIVGIIAVNAKGKLLLIEQFRPPVGKRVIEIPAGLAGDVEGHA